MISLDGAMIDLRRLEVLAGASTPIHSLDPRAKVLVTLVFIVAVVSFGKYELAALFPFFIFPAAMIVRGHLPLLFIVKKIALLCPFVLLVGLFNPLVDNEVFFQAGSFSISGGWVSLASILVRSVLTVGAAFILIGVTGFTVICRALSQMGVPQIFTMQLLFLYRYIFVLSEEASRSSKARDLRSCGGAGTGVTSFGPLVGHLLLRTWQRAENIHQAMLARGFSGEIMICRHYRFGIRELVFVVGWSLLFLVLRVLMSRSWQVL